MLKIRLMRIGAKKKPFYRVVVVDERAKRTGTYIELLGTYNPLTDPKDIKLKQDRIDHWVKQGARFSTGYLRIIGKAPQRPPRKPKKPARIAPSAGLPLAESTAAGQSEAGGEKKEETKTEAVVEEPEVPVEEAQSAQEKSEETKDERSA